MEALLGPCIWPETEKRVKHANTIAKRLGYREEDIIRLTKNPTWKEIQDKLIYLKREANKHEESEDDKSQAFVIINIGN